MFITQCSAPAHQPVVTNRCFRWFNGVKRTGVFSLLAPVLSLSFILAYFHLLCPFCCLFLSLLWKISCQYHIYIHVKSTDPPLGGPQSISSLLIILLRWLLWRLSSIDTRDPTVQLKTEWPLGNNKRDGWRCCYTWLLTTASLVRPAVPQARVKSVEKLFWIQHIVNSCILNTAG